MKGRSPKFEGRAKELWASVLRPSPFALRPSLWLPDMDLNHDKQIQSLLCYRYTIGQSNVLKVRAQSPESILSHGSGRRKETVSFFAGGENGGLLTSTATRMG